MVPVVDRPAIHWVVEEAIAAGIADLPITTGQGKRARSGSTSHWPWEITLNPCGHISHRMANLTLSIPDDLYEELKKHPAIRWSEVARQSPRGRARAARA